MTIGLEFNRDNAQSKCVQTDVLTSLKESESRFIDFLVVIKNKYVNEY